MKLSFQNGIIAGGVATLVSTIIQLLGTIHLQTTTTIHMVAKLIFPHQSLNLLKLFYGLIVHLTAGCLIGILIALLFRHLGDELPFLFSQGVGLFFWIVHILVVPNLAANNVLLFRTEMEVAVDLLSHLVYGGMTIFILKWSLSKA